ncbi:DEAD/DEAH box helicase [Syntrophomonas wolfei]|jgi:superfamily II DNA or RNA helicase|uniref:DEAD/DEAH box helicase n=1 Tax=Syntrophomonas wolfei TaxID=863 RepID=UPI0023F4A502|nr:DEAD/DEAH box helicase family protein [Syntrophomonas wolfei]
MTPGNYLNHYQAVDTASFAEDLFVELFQETFGLEKIQYLINEYPCQNIYGDNCYIDYALKTDLDAFAIEIDGEQWHNPVLVSEDKYLDDLLKRNSLTYLGWRVYVWTYRQLVNERDKVKSELLQFMGQSPHFRIYDDYLPRQRGKVLELRPYQEETLERLQELRGEYHSMALIADAQGTGKTTTAVLDACNMGLRTLFVAHTLELLQQAANRFKELWPRAQVKIIDNYAGPLDADVMIASIQGLHNRLTQFAPDHFGYIIIDEAHHAAATTYRKVLSYFNPRFLLGLTATPERHDQESIMEIFQNEAHRLDLKTAVEIGELVPIRCVRVKTNIDFRQVRINGIRYNYRDLDNCVHVPERNRLIVETYLSHVPGEKAVVFCASIQHAMEVVELFRDSGVKAEVVEGRMKKRDREAVLENYHQDKVKVLCACDILNEGWDSPETAVLFMARPTLSRVIYLQQLGRGTRKAPGKEALLVFDFIDNTARHNHAVNLHRLLRLREYRPGTLALAPQEEMEEENRRLRLGEKIETLLPHNIFIKDYELVDLFDWQEEIKDMMSLHELALELYVDDATARRWVDEGKITPGPDFELPMGRVTHRYFHRERLEDIRQQLDIPARKPEEIRQDFFRYVKAGHMTTSHKPVMLKGMLTLVNEKGQVDLAALVSFFRAFYEQRADAGLQVEISNANINRVKEMNDFEIARLMLTMPFEKFERKYFLEHRKDLNQVAFVPSLWKRLTAEDREELLNICERQIDRYYETRLNSCRAQS